MKILSPLDQTTQLQLTNLGAREVFYFQTNLQTKDLKKSYRQIRDTILVKMNLLYQL